MNWESLLGPGLGLFLAGLGGYGAYVRLSTRFDGHKSESDRRFGEGESDRKDLRLRLEAIDRDAVRKADLAVVKTEIIERVKEAEHNFRNDQAKAIGETNGLLRTLLGKMVESRS